MPAQAVIWKTIYFHIKGQNMLQSETFSSLLPTIPIALTSLQNVTTVV